MEVRAANSVLNDHTFLITPAYSSRFHNQIQPITIKEPFCYTACKQSGRKSSLHKSYTMEGHRFRAPKDSVEYEEFFNAASEGDVERLEAALLPSLDVNALEADRLQGRAALHMAAQTGSVPAVRFLLSRGAKVDFRNSEYETSLHEAAFFAHPEAIEALLDAGSQIDLQTGDYSYTALHNVLKYKNTVTPRQIETIELLLDRGLDVNAEADGWGSTLVSLHLGC